MKRAKRTFSMFWAVTVALSVSMWVIIIKLMLKK